MKIFKILILLFCIPTIVQAGFPYDKGSKNIAALFTMTNEDGRIRNLEMMESIFNDTKLGFEHRRFHNKPSAFIYDKLTELSKEVGEYGTLLIYLNSHGGGTGSKFGMTSSDGSFKFSKALNAIAKGNKVKRLIVFIDTCHAAGGINEAFNGGEIAIKTGLFRLIKSLDGNFYGELKNNEAYEEFLVIASSSADTLSQRGAFAYRLKEACKSMDDDSSIAYLLRKFASLHVDTNQKPYYKIYPNENMLDEPLFGNAIIRSIPIIDKNTSQGKYLPDYIQMPD